MTLVPAWTRFRADRLGRLVFFQDSPPVSPRVFVSPRLGFHYSIEEVTAWSRQAASFIFFLNLFVSDDNSTDTTYPLAGEMVLDHRGVRPPANNRKPSIVGQNAWTVTPRYRVTRTPTYLKLYWESPSIGPDISVMVNLIPLDL